jgi:AcrR family transcriptional regulator
MMTFSLPAGNICGFEESLMPYGAPLRRRRDAQRNRAAIVRAAIEVMSGPEPAVEMPEVARRAGVGLATVYRHFPDRQALVSEVVAHEIARLDAFVAANRDSPETFRRLLGEVLRTQAAMRSLGLLMRRVDAATRERYAHKVVAALTGPLRRAQECGYVRKDFAPDDLRLLFKMVDGVLGSTDDARAAHEAARRSIDLMLDGLTATRMQRNLGLESSL